MPVLMVSSFASPHEKQFYPAKVGLAAYRNEAFKAYEIVGSALDPAAHVTAKTLTVKQLLAPLSREDIKVVRCLGLNYADHAVRHY
jgi:hypothetical protein